MLPEAESEIAWLCEGISALTNVCDFAPPVSPRVSNAVCAALTPTGVRPLRFGELKVVEPSPEPKEVPDTANRDALLVRGIAEPSARDHPDGIEPESLLASTMPGCRTDVELTDTRGVSAMYDCKLLCAPDEPVEDVVLDAEADQGWKC